MSPPPSAGPVAAGTPAAPASAAASGRIEAAYDEYVQLTEAGCAVDPDEFCGRFPGIRSSLFRLIQAHQFLEENAHLLDDPAAVAWPRPGDSFLGFALRELLGKGAFSQVFLAAEPELGDRLVALKVSMGGGPEAQILGRLNHPNVVRVHSVRTDPATGLRAVCMPYMGRATLCQVLDLAFAGGERPRTADVVHRAVQDPAYSGTLGEPPPPPRGTYADAVRGLGAQLARALEFIHARGICHRDIKPSNVLVTPDGTPMLLDFNLSADPLAADSRMGGTLLYMSPEQLKATDWATAGEAPGVDHRSDLYSFGVVLYELFTGRHPFGPFSLKHSSAELRDHLLERQRHPPAPLRQLCPELDPGLAAAVEACLAHDPGGRPSSAAVAVAFERARGGRPARGLRRWAAVAAVALALASALAAYTGALRPAAPVPARPQEPGDRLRAARRAWQDGDADAARGHLTALLRADHANFEAHFLLGCIHQRLATQVYLSGDRDDAFLLLGQALHYFGNAERIRPDGDVLACIAYCIQRRGEADHSAILARYRQLEERGLPLSPQACNNYAQALQQAPDQALRLDPEGARSLRERRDALADKIEALYALALREPPLPVAYHNRAVHRLNLAFASKLRPDLTPAERQARYLELLERSRQDIDRALAAGPRSGDLYCDAARIYVRLAREAADQTRKQDYLSTVDDCLLGAFDHGCPPAQLRAEFTATRPDLFSGQPHFPGQRHAVRLAEPVAGPDLPPVPPGQG